MQAPDADRSVEWLGRMEKRVKESHAINNTLWWWRWLYFKNKQVRNIFYISFRTVVLIFIVVICKTMIQMLYPPTFFRCPLFIFVWKWFKDWLLVKKGFKKYENTNQIMMPLFFPPVNPRSITRNFSRSILWIWNVKYNAISYSGYFSLKIIDLVFFNYWFSDCDPDTATETSFYK